MLAYLIEYNDFTTMYYCGDANWCNNANHARKFSSKEEAEACIKSMNSKATLTAAEHMWCAGPADPFNAAKEALVQ